MNWKCEHCPPKLGGQHDRDEVEIVRGVDPMPTHFGLGTTPALLATPPDLGGELPAPPIHTLRRHAEPHGAEIDGEA